MLKKSLIALAVLAIAMPVVAGDLKVHDPWPSTIVYAPQNVTTIDVQMDVGYYIHVKDQKPIKVHQNTDAKNPYTTYKGCKKTDVISNFDAIIWGTVAAKSAAKGNWSAKFDGKSKLPISAGKTNVEICVFGSKVNIGALTGLGGKKKYKVAELTIKVLPDK